MPESLESLVDMTMRMVNFTVHDELIIKTRKLLSIEQFRDERARDLATKHFLTVFTRRGKDIITGFNFDMNIGGIERFTDSGDCEIMYRRSTILDK